MNYIRSLANKSISRFVIFGSINTILSNFFLLILINLIPVSLATFFSQLFHSASAYLLGKKRIFNKKGNPPLFILLTFISWILQWTLVRFFLNLGFSELITVLIVIPFVAINSFFFQKKFVFA